MEQLNAFHKTKHGYIVFAGIEIALLYLVASVAIDTANMWVYAFGVVLIAGIVLNISNALKLQFKK